MTSQVSELRGVEVEAWINFLRAHAAVTRQFNAELQALHGLTINDYDVLAQLARAPEQALKRVDLAERVLLTPSGITRLLKGLEHAGYVGNRSCKEDARVTYAVLTDEGPEEAAARRAGPTSPACGRSSRSGSTGKSSSRSHRSWNACPCARPTPASEHRATPDDAGVRRGYARRTTANGPARHSTSSFRTGFPAREACGSSRCA